MDWYPPTLREPPALVLEQRRSAHVLRRRAAPRVPDDRGRSRSPKPASHGVNACDTESLRMSSCSDDAAALLEEHRFETRVSFPRVAASQKHRARGTFRTLDRRESPPVRPPAVLPGHLTVNVMLHSGNLRHLADSVDYFLDKGAQSIILGPLVTRDQGWHRSMIEGLDLQFAASFAPAFATTGGPAKSADGVPQAREGDGARFGRALALRRRQGETLSVDPDGQVFGCVMFADTSQTLPSPPLTLTGPDEDGRPGRPALPRAIRTVSGGDSCRADLRRPASQVLQLRPMRPLRLCGRVHRVPCLHRAHPGKQRLPPGPGFVCAFNLVSLKYRRQFVAGGGAYEFLMGQQRSPPRSWSFGLSPSRGRFLREGGRHEN